MLQHLSIQNYALIEDIRVDFFEGFSIITGETGAGKSILLDALSLALGRRADLNGLRDRGRKCVVEAHFSIEKYDLQPFFEERDLDYDTSTILRREILPSGKSRAFVNDTPVLLGALSALGKRLIDIHSQHETLQLSERDFQFKVLDALADIEDTLLKYKKYRAQYLEVQSELEHLKRQQLAAEKEHDYQLFLMQELQEAKLEELDQTALEQELETLNHVESIQEYLSRAYHLLGEPDHGLLNKLTELRSMLRSIEGYSETYKQFYECGDSIRIELEDLYNEIDRVKDTVEADPARLERVQQQLQALYALQKKHHVSDVSSLMEIRQQLENKVSMVEGLEDTIEQRKAELQGLESQLNTTAELVHKARTKAISPLKETLETLLASLGMPHARFKIEVIITEQYFVNGKDTLTFLFAANKGTDFGELRKVASGGELSRVMLAIKTTLASYIELPTIIFDEIDTGVSGEISNKMGDIMKQMSSNRQVFAITHLPQVAARGNHHYKVYKEDGTSKTATYLRPLNEEERVQEIAEMLGGVKVTTSALAHAKHLLD